MEKMRRRHPVCVAEGLWPGDGGWAGNTFEEIMAENFPKLGKDIDTQTHDDQQATDRNNSAETCAMTHTTWVLKTKDKTPFSWVMRSSKALGLPCQEGATRCEGSGCPLTAGTQPGPMWCTLVTPKSMDFWRCVSARGASSSSTAQSREGGSVLAWDLSSTPNLPQAPPSCR